MVISDHWARRKAHASTVGFCPKCHKPYFKVGNFKSEGVCQCNTKGKKVILVNDMVRCIDCKHLKLENSVLGKCFGHERENRLDEFIKCKYFNKKKKYIE